MNNINIKELFSFTNVFGTIPSLRVLITSCPNNKLPMKKKINTNKRLLLFVNVFDPKQVAIHAPALLAPTLTASRKTKKNKK